MTEPTVNPIPQGMHTITPHLVCNGAAAAIEFYKEAFGAVEVDRLAGPGGKLMHAMLRIGDSPLMLVDEFPEMRALGPQSLGGSSVTIHLSVVDADAAFRRAVAAGATARMPVTDMFWGARYGLVQDPFGHLWSLATQVRNLTMEQIAEAMKSQQPMDGCGPGAATELGARHAARGARCAAQPVAKLAENGESDLGLQRLREERARPARDRQRLLALVAGHRGGRLHQHGTCPGHPPIRVVRLAAAAQPTPLACCDSAVASISFEMHGPLGIERLESSDASPKVLVQIHRFPKRSGDYELSTTPIVEVASASQAMVGLCHFGKGKRSPDVGMRTSGSAELGYVVSGRVLIETATGRFEARAGDVLTSSPTQPHSTTALEDSEIFFVLLDPV